MDLDFKERVRFQLNVYKNEKTMLTNLIVVHFIVSFISFVFFDKMNVVLVVSMNLLFTAASFVLRTHPQYPLPSTDVTFRQKLITVMNKNKNSSEFLVKQLSFQEVVHLLWYSTGNEVQNENEEDA